MQSHLVYKSIGMARTEKVVEDRRVQILEAALKVFAEKGFDRATNMDIAREAGITAGLIYHYFKSKQAVLEAAIAIASPLKVIRSATPDMLDQPPRVLLRTLFLQLFEVVEDDRFISLMKITLPAAIHGTVRAAVLVSSMQEATAFLERYLRRWTKKGELRIADPGLVSHLLLGALMDMVLRRKVVRDPSVSGYTHSQIVDSLVSMALQGLQRT
jgi:AcrR family transcriptional regulator